MNNEEQYHEALEALYDEEGKFTHYPKDPVLREIILNKIADKLEYDRTYNKEEIYEIIGNCISFSKVEDIFFSKEEDIRRELSRASLIRNVCKGQEILGWKKWSNMLNKIAYENDFEEKQREMIVLILDSRECALVRGTWLIPSVSFAACVFTDTDEYVNRDGWIEWLIDEKTWRENKSYGYEFEQYGIYRILARKRFDRVLQPYMGEGVNFHFLVEKVLEENVQNEQLMQLREELKHPIMMRTKYGVFTLSRQFQRFEGKVSWNGEEIRANLKTDEKIIVEAKVAKKTFMKYMKEQEKFDLANKMYAAESLLDLANEDIEEKITKEQFIAGIKMTTFDAKNDGRVIVYYSAGDIFFDHEIEIRIDKAGNYESAVVVG